MKKEKITTGKSIFLILVLCITTLMVGFTNFVEAALIDNGDGTITDDDLGIMWLQESFDVPMTWDEAMTWAANLVFAGYDDWRLPSAVHFDTGLPDTVWNSINNEWGHLYGVEWGNPAFPSDILPMTGYSCLWYWTSTEDPGDPLRAYGFFVSYDGIWLNDLFSKSEGLCVTAVRDVIANQPPVADANGPYYGIEGEPVAFDGTGSIDPDGTIVEYFWDFGDGWVDWTGPTPSHTYMQEGIYTVTLTVTDDEGATDTDTTTATISVTGAARIVFEEAHLSAYTIGSNPAYEVTGGYAEFANYLTANGYLVSTIDPGTTIDASVLAPVDVLVIVAPQNSYSTSEIDAIETWVKEGGRLLLISDWGIYGTEASTIATRFGITQPYDMILDSDENVGGNDQWPYYDSANLLAHPVTAGVARVEMYASDGITSAPADEIPLIVTDSDGTATWYYAGSQALGVSVMNAFDGGTAGSGRLIVITDANLWDSAYDFDGDGDLNFHDSDNEILGLNAIDWLAAAPYAISVVFEEAHLSLYTIGSNPAAEYTGAYAEFANYLTANGYLVSTIDPGTTIDAGVLAPADVLVIVAPQNSYSTSEIDAIETWVKGGGNLLLISEWGSLGLEASTIATRFGITQPYDTILDSDENVGGNNWWPYYDGANLLSHQVTAGVARVEMYAGDGITGAPADEIPLIVTDSDGTAMWYYGGSPALGVSVMNAFDGGTAGSGRLIFITDSNLWHSVEDLDGDGDVNLYDSDNEILGLNAIDWLSAPPPALDLSDFPLPFTTDTFIIIPISDPHGPCGAAHTMDTMGGVLIANRLGLEGAVVETAMDSYSYISTYDFGTAEVTMTDTTSNLIVLASPGVSQVAYYYNELTVDGTRVLPVLFLRDVSDYLYVQSSGNEYRIEYDGVTVTAEYGVIQIYKDGDRYVLLVYGLGGESSMATAKVLAEYDLWSLTGTAAIVKYYDSDADGYLDTITIAETVP